MYPHLFAEITLGGLRLQNRLTMAPTYLGYAGEGGGVTDVLLDHYRLMAASGVAMVVVENCTVDFALGSGSSHTLRADTDTALNGLQRLAMAIHDQGTLACLQLNHAGRFAHVAETPVAPSAVAAFGRTPRALEIDEIGAIVERFVAAARRARQAGFDLVELHGGTGYLLAQFVSPRTNRRGDAYGGPLENRQRFPLQVVEAVRTALPGLPVGYRLLADEWLPDGLQLAESVPFAGALAARGVAYLSVMGGTYESFHLPAVIAKSKRQGYMLDLAAAVKKAVAVPVIAAGRLSSGALADAAIQSGQADLVGLARVLWADPQWPGKVAAGREAEIIHCSPDCPDVCTQMVMKGRPALCTQWPPEKTAQWKAKLASR